MKEKMLNALRMHAKANVELHLTNIEVYLKNPAGIGEHSDILEAIQCEMDKMSVHEDRLDILNNYLGDVGLTMNNVVRNGMKLYPDILIIWLIICVLNTGISFVVH